MPPNEARDMRPKAAQSAACVPGFVAAQFANTADQIRTDYPNVSIP
jgi:hypothetical protein